MIISIDKHLDALNMKAEVENYEHSIFKDYFLKYWLSEKWLTAWIDGTRPDGCESSGLWRTNNYTEAQIKRICHTYLRRKQAVCFSEYLRILGADIMKDTILFANQIQLGKSAILGILLIHFCCCRVNSKTYR